MTRKRFVKLLMACGWSRDRAQALAGNVAAGGYSYAAEMQDLADFYRLFTVAMPREYSTTTFEVIL